MGNMVFNFYVLTVNKIYGLFGHYKMHSSHVIYNGQHECLDITTRKNVDMKFFNVDND